MKRINKMNGEASKGFTSVRQSSCYKKYSFTNRVEWARHTASPEPKILSQRQATAAEAHDREREVFVVISEESNAKRKD